MKVKHMVAMSVAALVGCVLAAGDNTPGYVNVEWSLDTGEKWEVKGLADRETGRPMATNTIFSICSNTKPITSVLALTFVEEGKLNLDDPVSKYFPEFSDIRFNSKYKGAKKEGNKPERPILLRHLITHLSGLCYSARTPAHNPDMVPLADQVKFAVEKGVSHEPGEKYVYNGIGFMVMGAILEKISGKKVDVLMQERVFDPLGMNDTTFYPSAEQMARAAVVYHYPKDGGTPKKFGFRIFSEPLDNRARTPMLAGGLFSTAGDYLKFEQMLALKGVGLNGKRILKEETFDKYLAARQTPPGDKRDASFDIHFNKEHTGGHKGGLYGTFASADWAQKSCRVSFKAVSAKIPKEMSGAAFPAEPLWAGDTYDLVIAGGTLEGVRLAVREAAAGRKVYLVAPRPYLGEDRAATLILDRQPSDDVNDPLVREIFNPAYRAAGAYNNLKSKGWRAVEKFAPYESVETAPVPAGELDTVTTPLLVKRACDRALIAAGVKYLTGAQVVGVEPMADGTRKILISMRGRDQTVTARAFADRRLPASVAKGRGRFSFRYVVGPDVHVEKVDFEYDVPYAGVRGWMAVQNHARTLVPISQDLLDVAEMVTVEGGGAAHSADNGQPPAGLRQGCGGEALDFDVVVAGGGTGGGPAAMGAARSGAKTLVVEFQHVLGGVSTEGRIGGYGGYYDGNVTGFTTELDRGAKAIGRGGVYFFAESEFLRRGVVEAGGEVWLGAMVSGAEVKDGRLTAVKVTLPDGSRVSVPCKAAVDATGNCDLASAAGCATEYIDPQELSLQGVGMAGQPLGVNCCNSDVGFVDETDAEDLCAFALRSRLSLPDRVWNQSSLVDSRERRRVCGRFRITPLDLLLNRTYPDTVCIAESAFDTHGQTVHPIFLLRGTGTRGQKIRGNVPFRALLPQDVEGILVTGLGVSAHRDSMPVLRMKADIRNMGYAAGLAAAMAAEAGVPPSALDVKRLQRKLIAVGNLPPAVLEAKDSFPLSDEAIAAAAKRLANGYDGLAEIFSDPARALPALRQETCFEAMHVRALLGDSDAAPALVERLAGATWDEGWNFKGMSQYDRCVSKLDAIVLALGPARNPCALPALDALARQLTGKSKYSHFRALARAYGAIGGKDAAASLATLLKIPGVSGHAIGDAVPPPIPGYSDLAMNAERSDVLRELCVAAALYRIGDPDGSAERSLRSYLADPRRVYANFARKVLAARP